MRFANRATKLRAASCGTQKRSDMTPTEEHMLQSGAAILISAGPQLTTLLETPKPLSLQNFHTLIILGP